MRSWVAAILLGVLGVVGVGEASTAVFRLRDPGEPLPGVTLEDLEGRPHELAVPPGRPVLLFFWSVYCPNCKEAVPALVEVLRRHQGRELLVWAVNVDGDRFSNAVRAFVRDSELPFPVVYDRLEGEYLVIADPLGVSKTPTLYVAGADGKIVHRQVIEIDFEGLDRALADLGPR